MIQILIGVLLFLGLYRFITRILFPILRISSAVRGQMKHMHQQANRQASASGNGATGYKAPTAAPKKGDYIEYEEVR
jgi:hypothetical protein